MGVLDCRGEDLVILASSCAVLILTFLLPQLLRCLSLRCALLIGFACQSVAWGCLCVVRTAWARYIFWFMLGSRVLTLTVIRATLVGKFGSQMHGTALGIVAVVGLELPADAGFSVGKATWHWAQRMHAIPLGNLVPLACALVG